MSLIRAKPLVDLMHAEAEANWIEQNEPEIWKQVHKFLLLSGYHNYKLTGQYNDAIASTVGFVPFEYKTCLLYTSPSPRDVEESRMPSSA